MSRVGISLNNVAGEEGNKQCRRPAAFITHLYGFPEHWIGHYVIQIAGLDGP